MKNLILITLSVLFFSCSSDSPDSVKDDKEVFYRLIKEIVKDKDGNIDGTIEYKYNSSGQLTQTIGVENGITYISTISYNNGKPLSISKSQGITLTYTYNGDLITSRSVIEDDILFTHQYTYNASKQMISEKQYNDGVFCCENTYEYNASGNIIERNGNPGYEYDDKHNPLKVAIPIELFRIDDFPNSNNILKINSETRFSYEYNEKGYPIIAYGYFNNEIYYTTEYTYNEI